MNLQKKLPRKFYTRNVHIVAKELLGKFLVRKIGRKYLIGKIVEVEAYDGLVDEAAHTYSGRTKRNEVMFNEGGFLYVYFTYGMHFCSNVVTGKLNEGKAVLLRALEPVNGMEQMAINRFWGKNISALELKDLTNGPAKICRAFGIAHSENGTDLTGEEIFILASPRINANKIASSTRIGIKKSVDLPWRYYIKNNSFLSRK